ncbi:MAG: RsmE family RNA methyltransferase [Saprospiraceae bacterium]|nr:16S rRNA (uracil(1498)-N(3))-methyltransferase [Saprospiraceae bacterium]MDW8230495.1 RsmE family RNA methyltransferase [Saprospiraceae bacterium]
MRDDQLYFIAKPSGEFLALDEEESRHLLTVMRGRIGERVRLTDGRGTFYEAELVEASKRQAYVRILETHAVPPPPGRLHLAIAPTKHIDRFEWLLEKATELGVWRITPLLCQRSERTALRMDRLEKILIAALKQSFQAWMPQLHPLTPLAEVVRHAEEPIRAIAWCGEGPRQPLQTLLRPRTDTLILIGPEGDFSLEEVALAQTHGFAAVSLGASRLRTETAGMLAAAAYRLLVADEDSVARD